MIRTTQASLKFANIGKRNNLDKFLKEYRRVCQLVIDKLWETKESPKFVNKDITKDIKTYLPSRAIQCSAKQASAIIRGIFAKQIRRERVRKILIENGENTTKLDKAIERFKASKPKINNAPIMLDSRFIKIEFNNKTNFDGWITICPGDKSKIIIPFKRHKHFNKLYETGKMATSILIGKDIRFSFQFTTPHKQPGKKIGIDVGINNVIATSEGYLSKHDKHGHTLNSILRKMARRKKGSVGYRQAETHQKNFINWSINRLNLSEVSEINRENIKLLNRKRKLSRFVSNWAYWQIFSKLDRFCEEQGVLVTKVSPAYTSQTCSICHCKGRRTGKLFSCSCGTRDADINAALNIRESIVPCPNVLYKNITFTQSAKINSN